MRVVLCCGDRNWDNFAKVYQTLKKENKRHKIDYVVEGGQESHRSNCGPNQSWTYGGDYQSKKAAQKLGIQVVECEANWDFHGRAAGPIRNENQLRLAMSIADISLDKADDDTGEYLLVLAFHSDIENSKGTKDMVNRAKNLRVKVKVIS